VEDETDPAVLSKIIWDVCGLRLDQLDLNSRLSEIGLEGMDLLACVGLIETRYGIEFPHDLLPALETLDDLLHYTAVKRSQL
jgi:acyl carrier protein